jgi:hypothetical protein
MAVTDRAARSLRRLRLPAIFMAILVAIPLRAVLMAGPAVLASCNRETAGAKFFPSSPVVIGAKMAWKARSMTASDWADNGFAAETLWVYTDGRTDGLKWVEAGVTQGWNFSNILTFYTAHGDYTNNQQIYSEQRWSTPSVSLGTSYTFAGYSSISDAYRTTINDGANSWVWFDYYAPTKEFTGGSESTCGPPSQITKTYVGYNDMRRQSDGAWILATGGQLFDQSANGGSAWCTGTIFFRYWLNDPNTTGCS